MTTTAPCPTCKAVATKAANKYWPFCRERCSLVDLGRWLNEEYRIPDGGDGSAAAELRGSGTDDE